MKAFVKVLGFNQKAGKVHVNHTMRVRTQRKELEGNEVKVIGKNPLTLLEEGFEVKRTGKKGRPVDKPLKEIVVSELSMEQAETVREYLERKLERTVYGVYHNDESHDHCHYMMKAKEKDTDKALRFTKQDLHELYDDIGKLLGHEITPYGQGRPAVPFRVYMADEEHAKHRIYEMKKQDEVIMQQIGQMLNLYGSIDLFALRGKGERGRFTIKENVKALDEIPLKRLKGINAQGDGILFRPHGERIRAVFIDDIRKEEAERLLETCNGVLVQTSDHKFQLHLKLEKGADQITVEVVQRALTARHEGDPASVDARHLRRLPGFANTKYDNKPFSRIVKYQVNRRGIGEEQLKGIEQTLAESNEFEDRHLDQSLMITDKREDKEELKGWNDFFDGDRSVADMRYTVYLISNGFKENEVKVILKGESPELALRKQGHVEDYINRTITNAKYYLGIVKEKDQSKIKKDQGLER